MINYKEYDLIKPINGDDCDSGVIEVIMINRDRIYIKVTDIDGSFFSTWEDACDYELDKQWYRETQLKELGI
jgi:hypothetical protein